MSDPEDRLSGLYQASKIRESPPAELDARVLAEAHRVVSRKRGRSIGAIGAAATVLLGVGLAWFHLGVPPALSPESATEQVSPAPAPAASRRILQPAEDAAAEAAASAAEQRASYDARSRLDAEPGWRALESVGPRHDGGKVSLDSSTNTIGVCGIKVPDGSNTALRDAIDIARARGATELEYCLIAALRKRLEDEANRE